MRVLLHLLIVTLLQQSSFKQDQLKHSRVKNAYLEKERIVKDHFTQQKLSYEGFHLFIRAFKQEKSLEVWVKEKNRSTYQLLTTYAFCSSSGTLGPKRVEGDLQIPEGIYQINHFNPLSNFHLSLGVSYPNASDKILGNKQKPGSAIYIHGNCVTIGCIPITDDKIKELYVLAVEAKNHGQKNIPLHIFPSRLDGASLEHLRTAYASSPATLEFWDNLRPLYQDFEITKSLRKITVDSRGKYVLAAQ